MIPKYTEFQKIVGGILHLITFRQFVGKWPSFESMDENCIKCKMPPQTPGCMKIGSEFPGANKDGTVQHSSSAVEPYRIEMEVEEHAPNQGSGASIPIGVGGGNMHQQDGCQ